MKLLNDQIGSVTVLVVEHNIIDLSDVRIATKQNILRGGRVLLFFVCSLIINWVVLLPGGSASAAAAVVPPPVFIPPPPVEGETPLAPPTHAKVISYEVQVGDTLWDIALSFGTDPDTLAVINEMTNWNRLKPGDVLKVMTTTGLLHKAVAGDTLESISEQYNVDIGEIIQANSWRRDARLAEGVEVIVPGARPEREVVMAARGELYRWPASGRITSPFGPRWRGFHSGIDIGAPHGVSVVASRGGRVTYSGWQGAYGILVVLDHRDGRSTYYAHLSSTAVQVGQWVEQGQHIGRVGSTGRSTGPHLHFEIRTHGKPENPLNYLP